MNKKATVPEKSEEQQSLEFMKTPRNWPNFVLPVKSRTRREAGNFPVCGIMIEESEGVTRPVVYINDFWAPKPLAQCETFTYESLDAVVADGWVVD